MKIRKMSWKRFGKSCVLNDLWRNNFNKNFNFWLESKSPCQYTCYFRIKQISKNTSKFPIWLTLTTGFFVVLSCWLRGWTYVIFVHLLCSMSQPFKNTKILSKFLQPICSKKAATFWTKLGPNCSFFPNGKKLDKFK